MWVGKVYLQSIIMVRVSLSLASWNGADPQTNMYKITPSDQTSEKQKIKTVLGQMLEETGRHTSASYQRQERHTSLPEGLLGLSSADFRSWFEAVVPDWTCLRNQSRWVWPSPASQRKRRFLASGLGEPREAGDSIGWHGQSGKKGENIVSREFEQAFYLWHTGRPKKTRAPAENLMEKTEGGLFEKNSRKKNSILPIFLS